MSAKKWLTEYFSFTRRDRIGLLALVLLIGIIYFLPNLLAHKKDFPLKKGSVLAAAIDSLDAHQAEEKQSHTMEPYSSFKEQESAVKALLFRFNPNTLGAEGWEKLGLKAKTIRTILNYRNKGGRFYHPEDLQKIWGLPPGFYARVKDSIMIAPPEMKYAHYTPYPKKEVTIVPINKADTAAFIALPGIGSTLASRIIHFREKLGGFYSIDQVAETYGLPDSTFQKIRAFLVLDSGIKKININTASAEELGAHPYIRWKLANTIIAYRNQHGSFQSLDDLKNIGSLDQQILSRLLPYLEK